MLTKKTLKHETVYGKIRLMANQNRFRILELTQDNALSLTELSKILGLSYTKCADYVRLLKKSGLVEKTKRNKEVLVRSCAVISESEVRF